MLNSRQQSVLCALVNEYVARVQPVGSKLLAERYQLGCSPATVRSELAALEDTGYVFQPHVSAGRIPTDTGYRVYVDTMAETGPATLPVSEADAVIARYAHVECEFSEVLRETSALLSQLTSYVAIVVAPTLKRARIRRVTIVPLAARRALVVVVTDSGQVANRTIELKRDTLTKDLAQVEAYLAPLLDGVRGWDNDFVQRTVEVLGTAGSEVVAAVLDAVFDCLAEADENRVVTGGVSALFAHPEFAEVSVARPLVNLLEDSFSLLTVLTDFMRSHDVEIRIGRENHAEALEHTSFVAARYGSESTGGVVGVIGPTRMDYRRAVASVRTVSDALTSVLGS